MATRNNPMAGRYFNDPNLAVAMSSLASAFAPPGAEDYLVAEKINGLRTQNSALGDLYAGANGNLDVLGGVAAGGWTPNQGFENFREQNANERRGQDIASGDRRFATEVGSADNRFNTQAGLVEGMMDPNGRNVIDPAYLQAIFGPGAPAMTSAGPVAPSETQARGRLVQEGGMHLNADDIYALTMEGVPTAEIVDPATGQPRVAYGPTAARDGATPFVNKGAEAAPEVQNFVAPDGTQGTAVYTRDRGWVDTQTQQPIPAGSITGKVNGTAAEIGATTSNITQGNAAYAEADYGLSRLRDFRALLEANPGVLGIPGAVRGFAQDVVAAANEMGAAYGTIDNVQELQALTSQMAARAGVDGSYDPAIAQARAFALEMAYLQAKMQDPGGEVNVRELERLLGVFDGGIAGNAKVLANLDLLEQQLGARQVYAQQLRSGAPGVTPQPTLQPGAIEDGFRYIGGDPANPNSWEPAQ